MAQTKKVRSMKRVSNEREFLKKTFMASVTMTSPVTRLANPVLSDGTKSGYARTTVKRDSSIFQLEPGGRDFVTIGIKGIEGHIQFRWEGINLAYSGVKPSAVEMVMSD